MSEKKKYNVEVVLEPYDNHNIDFEINVKIRYKGEVLYEHNREGPGMYCHLTFIGREKRFFDYERYAKIPLTLQVEAEDEQEARRIVDDDLERKVRATIEICGNRFEIPCTIEIEDVYEV